MDELLASILTPEQQAMAQQRAQQNLLLNLGFGLLGASQGQQGQPRPGFGQIVSQAGPQALRAYQESFDQTLKNILAAQEMQQAKRKALEPKLMTLKTPDGGEILIQVPPGGVPSRVDIPGLGFGGSSPKFDAATSGYIQFKYPGKSFADLSPEQKQDVIDFSLAPDATKQAELDRESRKAEFETGVKVPVPRGRGEFLRQSTSGVVPMPTPPSALSSGGVTPMPTPKASLSPGGAVEMPTISQVSAEITPKTAQEAAIKIPADIASKPLGEKEKPLIDSAAITPKAKQELILAQPKQTQAVEYVLETNTQMLSVIDELLANKGFDDAFGFTGETLSKIPGTNAARVRALLERLGGNLFIEAITAMRAASATGAAVGNATEKEGDKLQGSRAALMQAQKAEDARKELETLRDTLRFQQGLVTNAYERTYGRGAFVQREPKKAPEQRKPLQSIFGGR